MQVYSCINVDTLSLYKAVLLLLDKPRQYTYLRCTVRRLDYTIVVAQYLMAIDEQVY